LHYGHCAVSNEIISFANNPACTNDLTGFYKSSNARMQAQLLNSDFLQKSICCLLVPKVDTMFLDSAKKNGRTGTGCYTMLKKTMLLNYWVVQTPMLWRDQQYENII